MKVSWLAPLPAPRRDPAAVETTHRLRAPVTGCANASRAAWRNCRSRPRSPASRRRGSPATGRPIASRWTRIWCVRPVSSRRRRSACFGEQLLELEMRHGCARRGGVERVAEPVVPVAADRRLDRALPRPRRPATSARYSRVELAPPHEPLQPLVRLLRARDDEQAGRVAVETVDDARPVLLPARCARGRERVRERPARVARRRDGRRRPPACPRREGARRRRRRVSSGGATSGSAAAGAGGSISISSPPASLWLFRGRRPSTSTAPASSSRSAAPRDPTSGSSAR